MNWTVEAFDGRWCDGFIPKFRTFNYHKRNWEVKTLNFLFIGWGLFVMDSVRASDILLPFMGPQYTKSKYQKMKSLLPGFKSYVPKVEDDIYMDVRIEDLLKETRTQLFKDSPTNHLQEILMLINVCNILGVPNACVNELLKLLKHDLLPKNDTCPPSHYEANKLVRKLDLS